MHGEVVSQFSKGGSKFFITTDGLDGQSQKFEVVGTVGTAPLQQYLVETNKGHAPVRIAVSLIVTFCMPQQFQRSMHPGLDTFFVAHRWSLGKFMISISVSRTSVQTVKAPLSFVTVQYSLG